VFCFEIIFFIVMKDPNCAMFFRLLLDQDYRVRVSLVVEEVRQVILLSDELLELVVAVVAALHE